MEQPILSGVRALIVDHDTDHAGCLGTALSLRGAHIRIVASLGAARRALADESADVVITELWLRDGTGTEVLYSVRDEETHAGKRCIVIAMPLLAEGHLAVRRTGFDAFFAKSAPAEELLGAISALLSVCAKH